MKSPDKTQSKRQKPKKKQAVPLHPESMSDTPSGEAALREIIADQSAVIQEKEQSILSKNDIIDQKSVVIDSLKDRVAALEEYLRLERARSYGRSSEKHPGQGHLFDEVELEGSQDNAEEALTSDDEPGASEPKKKTGNGGRKPLSPSIPREQVHIKLSNEVKEGAIDTFFSVVKEELDIVPAKVRVIEYLQEKAVFSTTDQDNNTKRKIINAPLPKHPLQGSIGSVGLLAYIIVAKYCDGLPLYRLENILQRYGGSITRTTMANWMIRLSAELQPLTNLMREHQLSHNYLQADETRIQVLKEPDKAITSDKYMWVTLGGPPNQPAILFDYDPSRSKAVPLRLMEGFSGYLQTDGYAGYDAACVAYNITHLGCMDHLRRKFTDAQKAQPKKARKGALSKADIAINKLQKLYGIEQSIKHLSSGEKYDARQKRSVPALEDFKNWVDKNSPKIPSDSLTGKAFGYAINQWPKLIRYCDDGDLHISNIRAENAIRPFVIGRKNWLFADTPKGARASATLYSLVETAKANGIEPYEYFRVMLARLAYAGNVEDFEKLLPWNIDLK
jgi:Transposase and inactivated derivatives